MFNRSSLPVSSVRWHAAVLGAAAVAISACSDPTEPVEELIPPFSVATKLGDADPGITILRSDGSIESRIACQPPCSSGLGAPRWSQDGRKLSVTARNPDRSVLFVVNRDGSGLKEVASVAAFTIEAGFRTPPPVRPYLYEDWSMDGRLAYVRTSASGYAIEIVAEDGSSRKTVFTDSVAPGVGFYTRITRPRWGPSDATISFVNNTRIYIMNADGTNLRVLSDTVLKRFADPHSDPSDDGVSHVWSPNGRMVAFPRGSVGSARDLMIHDVAAGVTRKVSSGVGFGNICWSPNSAGVAFVTYPEDFTDDIVTINADGTGWREEVRDLWRPPGSERSIGWSPDGKYLVYQTYDEGKFTGPIRAHNVLSGADIPFGDATNVVPFVAETRGCL